jgi:hypothetical protein
MCNQAYLKRVYIGGVIFKQYIVVKMQHYYTNTTVNIFPIIKRYRNYWLIDDLFLQADIFWIATPPIPPTVEPPISIYIYMGLENSL